MSWYNLPPIRFEAHNGISNAKNGCCPNCGAQVNSVTLRCEYCGTQFSEDMVPIVVERPEIRILQTNTKVDLRMLDAYKDDPTVEEHIKRELAYRMAVELLDDMEFMEEVDPVYFQKTISARMRVVKKGFRFS